MRFVLHQVCIEIQCEDEGVRQVVQDVLEHFGCRTTHGEPTFTMGFQIGPMPSVGGPVVALHLDVACHRQGQTLFLASPRGTSRVERARSTTWLPTPTLPLHLLTYLLTVQLRQHGIYILHAGCVAHEGRGCVVIGDSGAGKSTLTLALLLQGWAPLSDDSVLVWAEPEVQVGALRRGVFLEPEAAQRTFPQLTQWEACPLVEASKKQLTQALPAEPCEQVGPHLLVFPEVSNTSKTTFEPMTAVDVLYELIRQSRLVELEPEGTRAHLEVLGALASACVGVRMHQGQDVLNTPASVARALIQRFKGPEGRPVRVVNEGPVFFTGLNDGTGALFHSQTGEFVALNPTAVAVWEHRTLPDAQTAALLAAQFGVSIEAVLPWVQTQNAELRNGGWL